MVVWVGDGKDGGGQGMVEMMMMGMCSCVGAGSGV